MRSPANSLSSESSQQNTGRKINKTIAPQYFYSLKRNMVHTPILKPRPKKGLSWSPQQPAFPSAEPSVTSPPPSLHCAPLANLLGEPPFPGDCVCREAPERGRQKPAAQPGSKFTPQTSAGLLGLSQASPPHAHFRKRQEAPATCWSPSTSMPLYCPSPTSRLSLQRGSHQHKPLSHCPSGETNLPPAPGPAPEQALLCLPLFNEPPAAGPRVILCSPLGPLCSLTVP